jgi:antitoxin VapB
MSGMMIMSAKIAKIFMNGRSQAVRLPKEFRFETDEVYITKRGSSIIISAIKPTWDEFFDAESVFDADYLTDKMDAPPQERDFD